MSTRIVILISAVLLMVSTPLSATYPDFIGIFADEDAIVNDGDIIPYAYFNLYIVAFIPNIAQMTGARFKIENWPGDPGYPVGVTTLYPTSDQWSGDLSTDFEITWPEIQFGPFVTILRAELLMFDPEWIGEDYMIAIRAGDVCHCIRIVDGESTSHGVRGCGFCFNLSYPEDCYLDWTCVRGEVESRGESWGLVKSLY